MKFRRKAKRFSNQSSGNFFSLQSNISKVRLFPNIKVNNTKGRGTGSEIVDIYPKICLVNHDCLPNTHTYWKSKTESSNIHVVCTVETGEKITIAYRPVKEMHSIRDTHSSRERMHLILRVIFAASHQPKLKWEILNEPTLNFLDMKSMMRIFFLNNLKKVYQTAIPLFRYLKRRIR